MLVGKWQMVSGKLGPNEMEQRIAWLITEYLIPVACGRNGWFYLFQDPHTQHFYQLSFPERHLHSNGGPMQLEKISKLMVKAVWEVTAK